MVRFLIFLVGMLTTRRPGGRGRCPCGRANRTAAQTWPSRTWRARRTATRGSCRRSRHRHRRGSRTARQAARRCRGLAPASGRARGGKSRASSRGPRSWSLVGLVFRKVIAWAVLVALSAALHLFGINVRLPHIKLAWPWQTISAGTTTDTDVGPWVLQKIEGISRPALGTENFNFTFTHKVSKNIGIWPCWYSGTFAAVGHASATVDLNPGPTWWTPASGHYRLQVLSRPATGVPGRVSVIIVLPQPQLPQSVHDVTVDNTLSHPIDVQHSWTYPGLGCGAMIRPQFSVSVLYAQAQSLAFAQVRQNPQITRPLISTAEAQAAQIIRNNFVQPTVNALGYTLVGFTIHWSAAS